MGRSNRSNSSSDSKSDSEFSKLQEIIKVTIASFLDDETSIKKITDKVYELINKKFEEFENKHNREVALLKMNIENLEQYSRRNSVRIFGVEEEKQENVESKIIDIFCNKMKLDITSNYIDRCHRVGPHINGKKRPIIVKMCSYRYKKLIYNNKKLLKGTPYVIKEDLTASRTQLLKQAQLKFTNKNVWTSDGTVFANYNGKNYKITKSEDLLLITNSTTGGE